MNRLVLRARCSVLGARCRVLGAALLVVALQLSVSTVHASDRYDPRLRFRTLATQNFDIHFHQGEEALARKLAVLVEAVATELEPKLGRPRGRVHVILVNQDDLSNGWATPVPFNVIEIVAAAPRGSSLIGNITDWMRLVFVHEYTHIVHLDRSRGLFGGLRRVFGRHPALMPNIFVPPWQTEGLATFHESAATGEGRVPNGDFRLLLTRAAASERFASLDRASSVRVDWPSGNTPYLYGAYFHEYLARKYGDASLTKLADATAGRVPYFGAGAFKDVFNAPLGQLWQDFERDAAREANVTRSSATRLTHHGFVVSAPAYSPEGRLFYSVSNPHGFPSLMELSRGEPRQITTRVAGGRMAAGNRAIVFDQLDYVRSVGVQSDLYAVSLQTGGVQRLTREARAGDPDQSPDGRTIVCTIQDADRRFLATLPAGIRNGTPAPFISEAGTHYASPRWSPDGRSIVAERQRTGAHSDLVIIDTATRAITRTIGGPGRNVAPSWTADGRVVFASDRDGGPFRIYVADVPSGELRRLVNAGDSAQSPVVSPDGQTLVFVGYTSDGYDLFSLSWDQAEWQTVDPGTSAPSLNSGSLLDASSASQLSAAAPPATYRPGRQLLPRFWTPIVEVDEAETSFGAATAGSDALGRHAYAAGTAWSTEGRADWYAVYIYDRWRPGIFADTSGNTDAWLGGEIRTRELNAGASIPFRRFRRAQSLFASFHVSSERFECPGCDTPADVSVDRRALRAGWSFSTAKEYGYSISREDGVMLSAASEWSPSAFGSTGTATTIVLDARGLVPAFPRHGVFAVRGAGAASWGDEEAVRRFGAAGPGPRPAGASFDREAIALIRGFDDDEVVGRRAAVVNAEYRVPLTWIERGAGTWPFLLRSIHGAAFVDAGAAWDERLTSRSRRVSAGVELSADVVAGYVVPFTLSSGIAWRHDPTRSAQGAAFYARVGRAF